MGETMVTRFDSPQKINILCPEIHCYEIHNSYNRHHKVDSPILAIIVIQMQVIL